MADASVEQVRRFNRTVTEPLLMPYLYSGLGPVSRTIGQKWPMAHIAILYSMAVVMLALPQMTLALIGGFLFRKFTIAE